MARRLHRRSCTVRGNEQSAAAQDMRRCAAERCAVLSACLALMVIVVVICEYLLLLLRPSCFLVRGVDSAAQSVRV
jgi:hypothetical protein